MAEAVGEECRSCMEHTVQLQLQHIVLVLLSPLVCRQHCRLPSPLVALQGSHRCNLVANHRHNQHRSRLHHLRDNPLRNHPSCQPLSRVRILPDNRLESLVRSRHVHQQASQVLVLLHNLHRVRAHNQVLFHPVSRVRHHPVRLQCNRVLFRPPNRVQYHPASPHLYRRISHRHNPVCCHLVNPAHNHLQHPQHRAWAYL